MAEDHGRLEDEGTDGSMLPVVNVGATDTGYANADQDIGGGFEGGDWAVFEGDGFDGV
jgi:hypothetical protein